MADSVTIVPWSGGTDEQIAAILDAAQEGTIDLQQDAHWAVGDIRIITLASFVDGEGTNHAEQSIGIAISSFDNYMSCGCLLQFDFTNVIEGIRIHSVNSNYGGYGNSEVKTVTMQAIVNALPAWLKARLATFTCHTGSGRPGNTIVNVTGNKLALRSEVEIFGTHMLSEEGEGAQLPYYSTSANRKKTVFGSDEGKRYSCRSPHVSGFWYAEVRPTGGIEDIELIEPNDSRGNIAPFGCLSGVNGGDYLVTFGELTSVADVIRLKGGTSNKLEWPAGFAEAVENMAGGGSVLVSKTVTANKTYDPADDNADGYSLFIVNVPQVISAGRCPRSEQTTGFQYGTLLSTMSWEGSAEEGNS